VEEVARDIPPGTAVLVLRTSEAERVEGPSVFLPEELLEWEQWDEEALEAAGWNVSFVDITSKSFLRSPSRSSSESAPENHARDDRVSSSCGPCGHVP
jgi:hypothetical protein